MVPEADADDNFFFLNFLLFDRHDFNFIFFCVGKHQCIELENGPSKKAEKYSIRISVTDHPASRFYSNRLAEVKLSWCLVSNFRAMLN